MYILYGEVVIISTRGHMARYITLAILLVGGGYMILFVRPQSALVVGCFIALFLCITYVSALIITNRTSIAILAGLGISGILGMNYLIGFNLINTILLASFIMGVGLLTAKHHE